jgi:RNA polymerase sigma-70 factor (ECF subfamily)
MKNPDAIPEIGRDLRTNLKDWLQSANETSATALIEGLYPVVIRIIHNHLPRGAAPDDLAQDVFLQFFRTLARYDETRPLENWISRLALNVCLNALRSRKRRPEWRLSDFTESEQAAIKSLLETPSVETAEDRDLHEILRKLLHTLSAEDRIVVQLLHIEQKSAAEIAAITGWNSTVIKVRAFRARQKLRKALECLGYPRSL